MRGILIGGALAALAAPAGGCQSHTAGGRGGPALISPWLVLGGPGLIGAAERPGDRSAPEYGRNDVRISADGPPARRFEAAVIRTWDQQRNDNGTPREFSTTFTRTITTTAIP